MDLDLVVDALGGPTSGRFLRTLRRVGALFPIFPLGFAGAEEAEELGVTVSATQVRSNGAQLAELGRFLDDGTIRVVLDSTYPLADAREAHERAAPRAHSRQDRARGGRRLKPHVRLAPRRGERRRGAFRGGANR